MTNGGFQRIKRARRRVENAFFAVDSGWQFCKNNKLAGGGGRKASWEHWVTEGVPKASPFLQINQLPDLANIINL